jgi:hypothetical protein
MPPLLTAALGELAPTDADLAAALEAAGPTWTCSAACFPH